MTNIDKRNELRAAAAVGFGLAAQGLVKVSDATQHAAVALAKVAESLEQQTPEEPGTAASGMSGSSPYGTTPPPPSQAPWDRPMP
jgi:hypothetical protein